MGNPDRLRKLGADIARQASQEAVKVIEESKGEKTCPCCGATRVFRNGVWVSKEAAQIDDFRRSIRDDIKSRREEMARIEKQAWEGQS